MLPFSGAAWSASVYWSGQEVEMILAFPKTSWVVCALCLLIAVVVGAYRHGCKRGILLTRWILSAPLGTGLANYTLRRAQSVQRERAEVCDEALEFCGVARGQSK